MKKWLPLIVLFIVIAVAIFIFYIRFLQLNKGRISLTGNVEPTPSISPGANNPGSSTIPVTPENIEKKSTAEIVRGTFVRYSSQTGDLTLKQTMGIDINKDITINISKLNQVACWPTSVTSSDGSVTLLQDAYIPVAPGRILSWPTQTLKSLSNVTPTFKSSTHMMVQFKQEAGLVKENEVLQLIVFGC